MQAPARAPGAKRPLGAEAPGAGGPLGAGGPRPPAGLKRARAAPEPGWGAPDWAALGWGAPGGRAPGAPAAAWPSASSTQPAPAEGAGWAEGAAWGGACGAPGGAAWGAPGAWGAALAAAAAPGAGAGAGAGPPGHGAEFGPLAHAPVAVAGAGPPPAGDLGAAMLQQQAQQVERRFSGQIKRFFGEKSTGYGFIACLEARMRYGYDVYVHARQMQRCEVGDDVSFTIVRNAKGEPQARNVCKLEDEERFLAKQQRDLLKAQNALLQKRMGNSDAVSAGGLMDEEQAKRFQKLLKKRTQ